MPLTLFSLPVFLSLCPSNSYWIYRDGAADAGGGDDARQVYCRNGQAVSGNGQSPDNAASDCSTLVNIFDEDLFDVNGSQQPNRFWLPLSTSTNVAVSNGFLGGGEGVPKSQFQAPSP